MDCDGLLHRNLTMKTNVNKYLFIVLLMASLNVFASQVNTIKVSNSNDDNVTLQASTGLHWPFPERARGFNTTYRFLKPSVIESLTKWDVNVLRINVGINWKKDAGDFGLKAPLQEYSQAIKNIDSLLSTCHKYKIGLIISLNEVPKRREKAYWTTDGMRKNVEYIKEVWIALAKRYLHEPAIIAYDVFNEPQVKLKDINVWYDDILPELMGAIRKVDTSVPLIIEAGYWGVPEGFEKMKPFKDSSIIYSFHMYAPLAYTHQGIKQYKHLRGKLRYPGWLPMFNTSLPKYWDKVQLEKYMESAYRFQQKYKVRMFVGEFGVLRWAPGREQWVKDCIGIFEKYGWDWCFHSYAGWSGFNPTFGPGEEVTTLQDGNKTTETLKVLLQYFKKNKLN